MGGAGFVIIFVVAFVGCAIWSMIFLTFVAHYFLTIVTESGVGVDEIEFPSEGIADWAWKPFFCLWILSVWVVPLAVIVGPLLAASPLAFVIGFAFFMLMFYPLSMLSALYSQSWFSFMHPELLWRMVRRIGPFFYVQLMSFLSVAVSVGLLIGVFGHSFLWALPASFAIPTSLLLYARHWGRFSWLALNFLPSDVKKPKKKRSKPEVGGGEVPGEDDTPEMEVEEIDPHAEGISSGLPPAYPNLIQAGVPATPEGIIAAKPAASAAIADDEDEWSTDKSPYGVIEEQAKPETQNSAPAYDREPKSDADTPMSLSQYYDEKARKEKKERAARENADRRMPQAAKKTPSFQEAMLRGVWEFMIYSRTLRIWVNLVILTAVELFFVFLVRQFWPRLD